MKNLLVLLIASLLSIACTRTDQYRISGTIDGIDSATILLQKREAGKWIDIDSTQILDGLFSFNGAVQSPEMYYLTMDEQNFRKPLFIENSDISVTIRIDSVVTTTVKGSAPHKTYETYLEIMEPVDDQLSSVYKEYRKAEEAGDTPGMEKAEARYDEVEGEKKELIKTFAREHGNSVVAPYIILRNAWQFELPDLEEITVVMDTNLKGSKYYDDLLKRVDILRAVQVGQTAPDFTQNDTAGNPLSLSSLKGKVLLIDFWASWCGPCRAENPHVVEAWEKYHTKGFDVLGVSLDRKKEKWVEAIQEDALTWHHVSDLDYWNNAAAKLYGVNSIPSNVLLDQEGIIIARNLRGEDLMKKLDEMFVKE